MSNDSPNYEKNLSKLKTRRIIPNKGKKCSIHLYDENAICSNPAYCKGLCKSHYLKWYRHGSPVTWYEERPTKCTREGCEHDVHAKGFCKHHYYRLQYVRKRIAETKTPMTLFPCNYCGKPAVRSFSRKSDGKPIDMCQECITLMIKRMREAEKRDK